MKASLLCFLLLLPLLTYSQEKKNETINFEAGGFVIAIVPNNDGSVVYARTDIGGIYKQYKGSDKWIFCGKNLPTDASLMIQSIDISPFNNDEILIATGLSYLPDDPGKGLWKSNDAGVTWTQVLGPKTGNYDVCYGGNDFYLKIGGPCVKWHPSVRGRVIAGTMEKYPENKSVFTGDGIYVSDDYGNAGTFRKLPASNVIEGSVKVIAIPKSRPDDIWVGTDRGLWLSTDNGNYFRQLFAGTITNTYQIMLSETGGGITAYVTGGGLYRIENNGETIADLTYNFGGDPSNRNDIVAVTFVNNDPGKLLVSRIGGPTRISHDGGNNWDAPMRFPLDTRYNPKFTLNTQTEIYYAKVVLFQNPSDYNTWYMSGGAGCFISNDNMRTWRFNVNGINMPVVYHINFEENNNIYFSISDWGLARTTHDKVPEIINYSRKYTLNPPPPENNSDTYFPNITRALLSPTNKNRVYFIGGSVYTYYPAMAKSEKHGEPESYEIMNPQGLPTYPEFGAWTDAAIIDGVTFSNNGVNDNILLLMGGGAYTKVIQDGHPKYGDIYGLYLSRDDGRSFYRPSFDAESQVKYRLANIGSLFSKSNNLVFDKKTNCIYLYLEGGNADYYGRTYYTGGLFKSVDFGENFTWVSPVVDNPAIDYRGRGFLRVDPTTADRIYCAITNYGLYTSDDGGNSWRRFSDFRDAVSVDARGDYIAVVGTEADDENEYVYLSRNGGISWEKLYFDGWGYLPTARFVRFHPDKNELWVATGGQGVHIYRY